MKVFLFKGVDLIPVLLGGTETPNELIGSSSTSSPGQYMQNCMMPVGLGGEMMNETVS